MQPLCMYLVWTKPVPCPSPQNHPEGDSLGGPHLAGRIGPLHAAPREEGQGLRVLSALHAGRVCGVQCARQQRGWKGWNRGSGEELGQVMKRPGRLRWTHKAEVMHLDLKYFITWLVRQYCFLFFFFTGSDTSAESISVFSLSLARTRIQNKKEMYLFGLHNVLI